MTGTLKRQDGEWFIHHTCYRYHAEEYPTSIYPIDKDSLGYLSTLTMFDNPEGKEVEFKVVHRDSKGEIISDYMGVPIEEWTWEAVLIPPPVITWKEELKKVKPCPQRQDSLSAQLLDLRDIANRFGFNDAADYLKEQL